MKYLRQYSSQLKRIIVGAINRLLARRSNKLRNGALDIIAEVLDDVFNMWLVLNRIIGRIYRFFPSFCVHLLLQILHFL